MSESCRADTETGNGRMNGHLLETLIMMCLQLPWHLSGALQWEVYSLYSIYSICADVHVWFLLECNSQHYSMTCFFCVYLWICALLCLCVYVCKHCHLSGAAVFPGQLCPAGHQITSIYYTDRLTQWTKIIPLHHSLSLSVCAIF